VNVSQLSQLGLGFAIVGAGVAVASRLACALAPAASTLETGSDLVARCCRGSCEIPARNCSTATLV
jgi:hypothetical protein